MKKHFFVIVSFLLVFPSYGMAQEQQEQKSGGIISGNIVSSDLKKPMEYVNIVLYDKENGKQVTGTITNKEGNFVLKGIKPAIYTLKAKFMGYHIKTIEPIDLKTDKMFANLGKIELEPRLIEIEGVEVVEEKLPIEFKIDKKVVNVSKEYASLSGSAVDVLQNVPSVDVDVEGNVSLRGSQSFTVLINNRPTVLESNEALQQIPASTIDRIEIITNPSAKYDPEGISGIINIITKRRELSGMNGITNLNGGLGGKYGGDFLLNLKRTGFNAYFGADYNRRTSPGSSETENRTFSNDTTSIVKSSGDSRWTRNAYGLRGGIDLNVSPNDILTLTSRYGGRAMERSAELGLDEWTEPGSAHNFYVSESGWNRGGGFFSANIDGRHTFAKGHELTGQATLSKRSGDEESINEFLDVDRVITSGQRSTGEGPSKYLRLKLDYVLPLWRADKLEAGYQSRYSRTEDITKVYDYDSSSIEYVFMPEYSHTIDYDRDIHSLYTIYSGEIEERFGYQFGMRGEYTYRLIELIGEDENFKVDQWDGFPTAHISYGFSKTQQMMASYTRRIDRPRPWYLEPFETRSDAFNVRRGNPDLKPEYIDSYELGYQKHMARNSFSTELYYRVTHNVVERIRSVYDQNVMLHTVENVGTDYAFGTETMLYLAQFKWWNVNLMGNVYHYRIKGEIYGEPFSEENFNWRVRLGNTFKLGSATNVQVNSFYNSPRVTSQGERKGFFSTSAALKQYIIDKSLSVTLQVRDVFRTSKFAYTSEGTNFYSHSQFTHESPTVTLTITYNFNNYKPERKPENPEQDFEEQPMEEF